MAFRLPSFLDSGPTRAAASLPFRRFSLAISVWSRVRPWGGSELQTCSAAVELSSALVSRPAAATQQFQIAPSHSEEPPSTQQYLGWVSDNVYSATPFSPLCDREHCQPTPWYSVFPDSPNPKKRKPLTDWEGVSSGALGRQIAPGLLPSLRHPPSAWFEDSFEKECLPAGVSFLEERTVVPRTPSSFDPAVKGGDRHLSWSPGLSEGRSHGRGPPSADLWQKAGSMVNDALNFVNRTAAAVGCVSSSKASWRSRRRSSGLKSLHEKEGWTEPDETTVQGRTDGRAALSSSYTAAPGYRLQRQRRGAGRVRPDPLADDSMVQLRHMHPRTRGRPPAALCPVQRVTSGRILGHNREETLGQELRHAGPRRAVTAETLRTAASDGDCSSMTDSDEEARERRREPVHFPWGSHCGARHTSCGE